MMSAGRSDGSIAVTLDTQYAGVVDIEYLACTQVKIDSLLLCPITGSRRGIQRNIDQDVQDLAVIKAIDDLTAIAEFGVNSFIYWNGNTEKQCGIHEEWPTTEYCE